jgi:hypothetical protein
MINGSLFTEDFLTDGITEYPEWKAITDNQIESFKSDLKKTFDAFPIAGNPIEATTEDDLITPVLETLGWKQFLRQQTTARKGREDVPDYLLFENEESKNKANKEKDQHRRYLHGAAILEAKAWNIRLDRKGNQPMDRVPSNQIIRYLTSADTQSEGRIRWGILTNGRFWRLYYNRARSKSEDYLEIDLPLALELPGFQTELFSTTDKKAQDWVKVFYLLFKREAFLREREEKTFHERALAQARYWEAEVAKDLGDIVFREVFPSLLSSLKDNDPQMPSALDDTYLEELRDNALTLLYRLLFVLYAEDRNLLPVYDSKYDDYGFRKRVREDIAKRTSEQDAFSTSRDDYYHQTLNLFKSIDEGDESIGVPPYNGGLFDARKYALLNRARIPDNIFAPLVYKLSHRDDEGVMKWINYRDLSVQQLGSIYERLLEFYPKVEDDGRLTVRPNIFARKTSGSYYTPESLVGLIIERTVGPLLKEHREAFWYKVEELKSGRDKKKKNKLLETLDPATAMLELKVCDPAMGSGHFLVSLVDYLADNILESIDEVETEGKVPWADKDNPYVSPVSKRIASIRALIMEQAKEHGWNVKEEQLDDKHIVRRMILKRCVYGVDKNPMAVELAKVSLWLHTFTVGAPLSFLDHHLRCGDSLFGEWVGKLHGELNERGVLFSHNTVIKAQNAAVGMLQIEQLTDADISEVKQSASMFEGVEEATAPLNSFLQLYHAFKWIASSPNDKVAVDGWLFGDYGDPYQIAEGKIQIQKDTIQANQFKELLAKARNLIEEEHFLNWEVAFPGVWKYWERHEPEGGFDAVIGNPPWDTFEFIEVEWFVNQDRGIALLTGDKRRKSIDTLKQTNPSLWKEFDIAKERADRSIRVVRNAGQYPYFNKGKINLYSLFIERTHRLIKQTGFVGLLVPSGIAADKSASMFFRDIAIKGHLAALFDFENKKKFFPDIHASFKFCTYVAGGRGRSFDYTDLAFFLHDVGELSEPNRVFTLTHEDFARVNPNTGTAPIFRTEMDADITRIIYERYPILNDHGKSKVWPIKYMQGTFNMSTDSHLFKTFEELESEGFYRVAGNCIKKGEIVYVPLYEGKMVQAYDHRAASVRVNTENLNRPGQTEPLTIEEKQLLDKYNLPQYWVRKTDLLNFPTQWLVAFKDVTASTNMRTMIAMIIPAYGVGHTLPILLIEKNPSFLGSLICANLNSFIFDYIARQKVPATHLTWYTIEQLPVIPPETFEQPLGKTTVAEFIKDHVLHLTYTAWDMQPFAKDMGYGGEPFIWDEEDRRHRKAKLDALFFILYDISEEDADYILSTFPIVKRQDEAEHGSYLTRDLILAYMRALKAGDTEVIVKV